ncbi:unnamed protein product [Gongylonema pulchrum]|uniref:PCI domain-containing protein n=1 Tax=Gongylonema pulchrum TaxID=637853 RepID=A0A183E3L5_9BILA|nr:unnamed protein product [Gongylonema pulchrum]
MAQNSYEQYHRVSLYFPYFFIVLVIKEEIRSVVFQEPLPSEMNFKLQMQWTPASELKKANDAAAEAFQRFPKSTKVEGGHRRGSRSSPLFREHAKKRVPFCPRVRFPSNDEKIEEAPKHKQAAAHKRKKKQKKNSAKLAEQWLADERSNAQREERARRFARDDDVRRTKFSDMRQRVDWSIDRGGDEGTSDNIVGTCTDIEKSYFRLTSAPDPSAIRPLEILEKALKLVQQNYTNNRDYTYANDQLRSIRQDLMANQSVKRRRLYHIQCIRTDFTVKVYETNARIALEQGDREEYNQCQSQLKLLYREIPNSPNRYEFTSYRLLYYISVANTIDQTTLLSELDEKAREDPCIEFALKTREAWALGNYVKLFRLYEHAPRMASYVMDLFLERERKAALNACLKSFRPTITVSALVSLLGLEETKLCEWLATLGITPSDGKIDCRTHCSAITA